MITAAMRAELRRLVLVEGWRIETVARRYGVHHSVVRRALRDDAGERPDFRACRVRNPVVTHRALLDSASS